MSFNFLQSNYLKAKLREFALMPEVYLVFVILCVLSVGNAVAADIGVDENNNCYLLNRIESSDPPLLEQALKSGCKQISIHSNGGDVVSAMKMGRLIRQHNMAVSIPSAEGYGVCASACVLLYAAGVIRVNYGPVKIHRPYYGVANKDFGKTQSDYRQLEVMVKKYLRDMNVSETLFDKMMAIRPEDAYTLGLEEMRDLGMGLRDPVYSEHIDNNAAAEAGMSKAEWLRKKRATRGACGDVEGISMPQEYDRISQCWKSNFPEYFGSSAKRKQ